MQRALALIAAWLCSALVGCAGFGLPRSVSVSTGELEQRLQQQLPPAVRVFDLLEIQFLQPRILTLPRQMRLRTTFTLRAGSKVLAVRAFEGQLVMEAGLHFDMADASVSLVRPQLLELSFEQRSVLATEAQRLVRSLAERALDGMVLYRIKPERMQALRAAGMQPAGLRVTDGGIELRFEPAR
jgi:hypothetical protein